MQVTGFKSIRNPTSIEVRNLTLLCGPNSSGKSAFFQPFLLVKQTLEAGYDPGPLLLDGPNVSFGRVGEMLWKGKAKTNRAKSFRVGFVDADGESVALTFQASVKTGIDLAEVDYNSPVEGSRPVKLRPGMSHDELYEAIDAPFKSIVDRSDSPRLEVVRQRSAFDVRLVDDSRHVVTFPLVVGASGLLQHYVTRMLHLPGLRDLPERLYPATQSDNVFPGPFHPYVASVIAQWSETDSPSLHLLNLDIARIGLTWKVDASRIDDTKVALKVGRLPHAQQGGAHDLVNIADVGLGVSQTLPILVALRVAQADQLVYLEQPEIHLHPRAQVELGRILVDAARRGVVVICETHSHLLVRSVQAEVARDPTLADIANMHWFHRNADGETVVSMGEFDSAGQYGDFPLDFDDVELDLENHYLDLVQGEW